MQNRFEFTRNNQMAQLKYVLNGKTITFIKTDVPKILEGNKAEYALCEAGAQYAAKSKYTVKSECNFFSKYYEENPPLL